MKTQFIHIKNISEIDTSKATVYDLNKRFIDPKGNMYGLRYNRAIKKIEIIRLMRTAAKHSNYFTQKMIQNQKSDKYKHNPSNDISVVNPETTDFSLGEDDLNEVLESKDGTNTEQEKFEPDVFINTLLSDINTSKERLNGIIMNINNAKLYNWDDRDSSGKLDDILRNIDIDGQQRIDKFLNYYREIKEYPRSISFYLSKLDHRAQNIIENLSTEGAKMRFIYLYEVCMNVKDIYKTIENLLKNLLSFLLSLGSDHLTILNQAEKQHLNDAKVSIENTINEIHLIFDNLAVLENYIYTSKGF